jgi:DNA-binding transcriptional LysR family regulator
VELSVVALRSLHEVAQRGTMSAAAQALGYTPAAVSLHIASLSRAIGRPVVEQAGRGVRLTEAGAAVLAHARRVLDSQATLESALEGQDSAVSGLVTVGCFGSGALLLSDAAAAALRTAYPDLQVAVRELRETSTDNPVLAVSRSEVDVALDLDYPDAPIERSANVEYRVVARERFGIVGLAPEEGADEVSLASLAGLDWVLPPEQSNFGRAVRAACRRAGYEPTARHLVTDTAMTLRLVEGGFGITLATPLMLGLVNPAPTPWRRLQDRVDRHVVAIVRSGDRDRPVVDVVLEQLWEAARARGLETAGPAGGAPAGPSRRR